MSMREGEPLRVAEASDALDDLVSTVDDLARDLATPRSHPIPLEIVREPPPAEVLPVVHHRPPPPATPATTRFVVGWLVVATFVELVILIALFAR
jgi:hypothetical protein